VETKIFFIGGASCRIDDIHFSRVPVQPKTPLERGYFEQGAERTNSLKPPKPLYATIKNNAQTGETSYKRRLGT
jgi:hypothetical protein